MWAAQPRPAASGTCLPYPGCIWLHRHLERAVEDTIVAIPIVDHPPVATTELATAGIFKVLVAEFVSPHLLAGFVEVAVFLVPRQLPHGRLQAVICQGSPGTG